MYLCFICEGSTMWVWSLGRVTVFCSIRGGQGDNPKITFLFGGSEEDISCFSA